MEGLQALFSVRAQFGQQTVQTFWTQLLADIHIRLVTESRLMVQREMVSLQQSPNKQIDWYFGTENPYEFTLKWLCSKHRLGKS